MKGPFNMALENEVKALEMRLKGMESALGDALPDIQGGLVNASVAIGTIVKVLIDKKLVDEDEFKKVSEKIGTEMMEEYKQWAERKQPEPDTVGESNDAKPSNNSNNSK